MRPIWERNAPDTIENYDEFHKKRLQLAKEYDSVGAPKITAVASEHFQKGFKEATNKLQLDARQAIRDAEAKNQITNENGTSALQVLGQIVEVVAVVAVVVGAVAVGVLAAKDNHGVSYGGSCCKICTVGKACGDTCISQYDICHVGVGCACNQ